MPSLKDVYVNCDVLENIPKPNRDNWLKEIDLLRLMLPKNARVLQVGSMDGARAIRLLEVRPDLKITGLEIEASLVELAKQKIAIAGLCVNFIHGDITNPPALPHFDYVICLNNTLGYIPEQDKSIAKMKELGKVIIISVYGEEFDNGLAQEYFKSINLKINCIKNDSFIMEDFTAIKRYSKKEVESWGGKIIKTPVGYFSIIPN
ncbi:MAG TPA: class I SAM-dependent methyltransferase [Candidatus Moranbacteria bacterium]|nr:class I SAM-dependent methyltransferase [Candidatus Moranbacteria bacterium]